MFMMWIVDWGIKMKRVLCVLLFLGLMFCLSGCWNDSDVQTSGSDGRLTYLYNDGFNTIVRDNQTGVQYLSRSNCGTCVMVDVDGKPLVEK